MLCSGSLSVLLRLIIGRSVVVLWKFLFLVFLFRFGFSTECVCLLVYYWRIMFVPFLLLYHCCWYPYMLSWTLLVECVRYIVLRYVPLVCIKNNWLFWWKRIFSTVCRYVLLGRNHRFCYHRLNLRKFAFQDSLCAPRRAPVVQLGERLDIARFLSITKF